MSDQEFDWEVVERRFRLPVHLCLALGIEPCLVRVSKTVEEKIRTRHRSILALYEQLDATVERWEYAGPSRHSDGMFEVLVRSEDGRFAVIVVGFDRAGRMNLATMYSSRSSSATNRSREMIQRRRVED